MFDQELNMSFKVPFKRKRVFAMSSGGCDTIKICEEDTPVPGLDQILVEVKAAGLNFYDIYVSQGLGLGTQPPYALGLECAGIVRQVGNNVARFKYGDHVIVHCPEGGAFTDIVVTEESNVLLIPCNLDFEVAACLTVNYLTAHFSLIEMGGLQPGSSVLIQSAAGGVGWAATQIAKMVPDVRILGTASKSKHNDIVKNGVDYPLTYDEVSTEKIMTICREGVSIVLESLAGDSFVKSQQFLSPLGKVILIGAKGMVTEEKRNLFSILHTWWATKNVSLKFLIMENKAVAGFNLNNLKRTCPEKFDKGWIKILDLLVKGKIEPKIDLVFQLDDIINACKRMVLRQNIGKIVLKP